MNSPLPDSLARRWGNLEYIMQRGQHEWSSSCPKCGSEGHAGNEWPDRFRMFDSGKPRGWCRRCGYQDFADSDSKIVISAEERQKWLDERIEREKENLRRAQTALELLRREQSWIRYHACLGQDGANFWSGKGVPDWAVDWLELGWCQDKAFWSDGHEFRTPTATIPVFAPGRELVNIRHRLINPPHPGDKYRPDRAGLPAALYLTNPNERPQGECILIEGEIKAIVVMANLDKPELSIVGTPGKNLNPDRLALLSDCGRIWIVFDPDATPQAMETAKQIGKRARVVQLPCKADDAFTMYGAEPRDFYAALRYGRVVN